MTHVIAAPSKHPARYVLFAVAFALALITNPLTASPTAALAAAPGPVVAEKGKTDGPAEMDLKELKERLRVLGEAIRNAIEDVSRSVGRGQDGLARGEGGLASLAPKVRGRDLREVYGPKGPTLRSVRALLTYRLVLLGNDRLTTGRVYERDKRIIAEIVTVREKAVVARYMIDKTTGTWVAER